MPVQLNHLIVYARDSRACALFLSNILGLPEPARFGPFLTVEMANGITLDFIDAEGDISAQHYAFLVTEDEFESSFERIRKLKLRYWADPGKHRPGEINHHDGGRGVYFEDPSGHFLEIITRPYGSGG